MHYALSIIHYETCSTSTRRATCNKLQPGSYNPTLTPTWQLPTCTCKLKIANARFDFESRESANCKMQDVRYFVFCCFFYLLFFVFVFVLLFLFLVLVLVLVLVSVLVLVFNGNGNGNCIEKQKAIQHATATETL
jgi:hypothetical protein